MYETKISSSFVTIIDLDFTLFIGGGSYPPMEVSTMEMQKIYTVGDEDDDGDFDDSDFDDDEDEDDEEPDDEDE